jgi:two-component system, NtrC family, sensor histidine kinase PilS
METSLSYSGPKRGWLLPLRLTTFCLNMLVVVFWMGNPIFLKAPFLLYCIITLIWLIALLFLPRTRYYFLFQFLTVLQFLGEIFIEAGIVYATGSMHSPFATLFLLTIVSAALLYRLVGTLVVASLVSAAYVTVALINAAVFFPGGEIIQAFKEGFLGGDDALFYSTFLHISIFYLVAFISGYLAQKLQSKDKELHSTSAELKKARLETGDILYHLNSGLVTIDRAGDIIFFNRAAEHILQVQAADAAGRNARDVFAGSLDSFSRALISVFDAGRRATRNEFAITRSDGRTVPIGMSTSILYDEENDVRGVIGIFQDLTEAKRLEEQIRQADRMAAVGELSACMAHEIRNPLAAISGSVEVLKGDLPVSGDNERLLSLIVKETSRLNKMLSDFLLYARVGRTQFQKVDLIRTISDVMEIIRQHPAFTAQINLSLESRRQVVYISADEDQVKQLLLNLVVNACEALGMSGGTLQFVVQADIGPDGVERICLAIRDSGPGIPPDNLEKIFLPFYSTKKGGSGLGLAIVSRLMEAMGGQIEVYSQVGVGTEFRLYFRGVLGDFQSYTAPAETHHASR